MEIQKVYPNLEELYLLEGNRLRLLEELSGLIANTLALTAVGIGTDIQNYESHVIHEYFGAIDTLLQKIQELCLQIISSYFHSKLPLKNPTETESVVTNAENTQPENTLPQ
jgi:hypothetical protein